MLSDEEIEALHRAGESDRMERKPSLAQFDKIEKAVCAFANDLPGRGLPGVVLVGVEDDGSCADLAIDDGLLRRLSELRNTGKILPRPVLSIDRRTVDGCPVAAIVVAPSDSPPVRREGSVWVRVGPTNRKATPQEERRLTERRRAADLPFDIRGVPSARLEDLDLERFRREYLPLAVDSEVLAENQRPIEQQLSSLRMATAEGVPTALGLLVVGEDPRGFLPGAYLQFVRYAGTGILDPIKDQKQLDGPIVELLSQLDDLLRVHIEEALRLDAEGREHRRPDYPLVALQQLVRNAVLHRSYEGTNAPVRLLWFEDRVEILSPGGPYGQVTPENFGEPGVTDYRNPHLAEALRVLGYVQRFGMGIEMARKALADNGNPPPELVARDDRVQVILRSVEP